MKKVAIDIETVPLTERISDSPSPREDHRNEKAALDPLRGRVACISLVLLKDQFEAESALSLIYKDEIHLLRRFWKYVRENRVSSFIAHNGLGFDLPFLWKRSVINRVRTSLALDLRRYKNDFIYDTMAVWANWDVRSYPKLDTLAAGLGVGKKTGDGGDVAALWAAGKYGDIARYCLHDCWLSYACYCCMNFAEFVAEEQIPSSVEAG